MKRFGVWTLVVLIAIIDVGFVRPGFAQSGDSDFVPISGASGRSVRANVFLAFWTRTAPATGPVIFDTRGTAFDTLLTIYDAETEVASNFNLDDFTLSSEVRFTAQQGRAYDVGAVRFDGSYDPGTIVLNWQAASPGGGNGGGSRASADDFASSTTVSGASGRSKGSSIGATKESGEPDHSGDSGGASVWYSWTAPATGPVMFDTRGSNFDTLLAVYTGNSVNRLTEVASNDDVDNVIGTFWSEVYFRAQQGKTYHLAVDGYGGKSGTVVLNWRASSSDSGNSGSDDFRLRASLSGASGRSVGSNVGADTESGEPNHAGNSGGASMWWTWRAPTTGSFTFHTRGSDIDTLLAVYTGNSLNHLTEIASNDDADGETLRSAVRFTAQQGQTYHIAVDGYGGATGAIVLNWHTTTSDGVEVSLSGTVKNYKTGDEIPGATIRITQFTSGVSTDLGTTTTDNNGEYEIQVNANPGRTSVNAVAREFAPQSVIIDLREDIDDLTADLAMLPVEVEIAFQPTQDAEETHFSVSANSLMTTNGAAPTGEVTAMVTVLDASSDSAVMPGDFMSLDADTGASAPIESFGAMNVEFMDRNGESLDLRNGREAMVKIPLAERRDPNTAPSSMPLYYWSDAMASWIEEGEARLQQVDGKWAYVGSVKHFSTWNADKIYETVRIKGCVNDIDGNPAGSARVTAVGRDYIGSSSVLANPDGKFEVPVRRNSEVLLSATLDSHSNTEIINVGGTTTQQLGVCLVLSDVGATIELTWGEHPNDLASHLYGPDGQGDTFHVYWRDMNVLVGETLINHDVDDTNGYGPEVITIPRFPFPGTYYYLVEHWAGSSTISASPARVELNLGGKFYIFSPETASGFDKGDGTVWAVFKIEVDQNFMPEVVLIQEFRDRLLDSDTPS